MENNFSRVTEIIKSVFPMDFSHVPEAVLQNAIDFGNAVHKMCELDIKGTLDGKSLDPALIPYLHQFRKWRRDTRIEILGFEQRLISKKYNFTGQPDMFGWYRKRLCVVDLKTTTTIAKTIGLQLSGYKILVKENIAPKAQYCDGYVLRLFDDKYEFVPIKRKSDMSAFLSCMNLLNYKKEVGIE